MIEYDDLYAQLVRPRRRPLKTDDIPALYWIVRLQAGELAQARANLKRAQICLKIMSLEFAGALHAKGLTYNEIQEMLGIGPNAVSEGIKERAK